MAWHGVGMARRGVAWQRPDATAYQGRQVVRACPNSRSPTDLRVHGHKSVSTEADQSAPLHRTGSRQRWQRSVLENAQLRCRTKGESTLVASLQRSTFKSRRQTVCNAGSVNKRSDARGTHRPRFSCCGVEACRLLAMNQLASRNVNGTPGNAPSLHWQALLFEALNSSM